MALRSGARSIDNHRRIIQRPQLQPKALALPGYLRASRADQGGHVAKRQSAVGYHKRNHEPAAAVVLTPPGTATPDERRRLAARTHQSWFNNGSWGRMIGLRTLRWRGFGTLRWRGFGTLRWRRSESMGPLAWFRRTPRSRAGQRSRRWRASHFADQLLDVSHDAGHEVSGRVFPSRHSVEPRFPLPGQLCRRQARFR